MNIIKSIINYVIGIFTDGKGTISCKKVIGVLAWLEFLKAFDYCSQHGLQLPDCSTFVVATASALIGFNTFKDILSLFAKGGATK